MRRHALSLLALVGMVTPLSPIAVRAEIQAMPPHLLPESQYYPGGASPARIADARPAWADGYRPPGGTQPVHASYSSFQAPSNAPYVPPPPGMPPLPAADSGAAPPGASGGAPMGDSAFGALHNMPPWQDHAIGASAAAYSPATASAGSMHTTFVAPGGGYPASPFWTWQVVPDGIIYKSYLAGGREPRMGSQWFYDRNLGWLWDSTLGGRVGLIRYGTTDAAWPEGWQLDFEGAAFPRLDLDTDRDLISVDFRFGFPLTFRRGPWEWKFGYYHLCSHMGDEYLERFPDADRLNFVRDALVLGLALRPNPDWRLYVEAGYAPWVDGGSEPWEFQFGVDFSPMEPTGFRGAPFLAVNGRLREEVDFGGNFTAQAGWQWRGETGNLFRFGAHYFNGMSDQYQFFRSFEEHIGLGLWYDF